MKNHVYVFVRRNLSVQQQLVQASHAFWESGRHLHENHLDHPHLVVLGVSDETELLTVSQYLNNIGIKHSLFRESYFDNEATALATQPIFEDQRPLFSHFKLLGKEDYVSTSK
jgi:hypothetical protein